MLGYQDIVYCQKDKHAIMKSCHTCIACHKYMPDNSCRNCIVTCNAAFLLYDVITLNLFEFFYTKNIGEHKLRRFWRTHKHDNHKDLKLHSPTACETFTEHLDKKPIRFHNDVVQSRIEGLNAIFCDATSINFDKTKYFWYKNAINQQY